MGEQELIGIYEGRLDCTMVNWYLHLSLTTSKPLISVRPTIYRSWHTWFSSCKWMWARTGWSWRRSSRGLEELLAQLQLQASKVSDWVSDDSRELPQSKTALDFSVKTWLFYFTLCLSLRIFLRPVLTRNHPGTGNLRNNTCSLAKLTQYKATTFSCRCGWFSSKEINTKMS